MGHQVGLLVGVPRASGLPGAAQARALRGSTTQICLIDCDCLPHALTIHVQAVLLCHITCL